MYRILLCAVAARRGCRGRRAWPGHKVWRGANGTNGTNGTNAGPNMAVSDFQCVVPQTLNVQSAGFLPQAVLAFQPGASGVNLNGGVLTAGAQFSAFVFQHGSYTVQLIGFGMTDAVATSINLSSSPGIAGAAVWNLAADQEGDITVIPNTFAITVPIDNTIIQFNAITVRAGDKGQLILDPAAISDAWKAHKPVAVGIDKVLIERGVLLQSESRAVMRSYTRRRMYQIALAAGGARYGLDGEPCGSVDAEHRAGAARVIETMDTRNIAAAAVKATRRGERGLARMRDVIAGKEPARMWKVAPLSITTGTVTAPVTNAPTPSANRISSEPVATPKPAPLGLAELRAAVRERRLAAVKV